MSAGFQIHNTCICRNPVLPAVCGCMHIAYSNLTIDLHIMTQLRQLIGFTACHTGADLIISGILYLNRIYGIISVVSIAKILSACLRVRTGLCLQPAAEQKCICHCHNSAFSCFTHFNRFLWLRLRFRRCFIVCDRQVIKFYKGRTCILSKCCIQAKFWIAVGGLCLSEYCKIISCRFPILCQHIERITGTFLLHTQP